MEHISKNGSLRIDSQKIYLCATEEDKQNYLSEIAKEIFDIKECVIFYRTANDDTEISREEIGRMQICVVLVTAEFLAGRDSQAFDDFKNFLQAQIPVLPILIEEELEEWFDKVCGNLHCLKRNEKAIYKNSLNRYLEQIFTSDKIYSEIMALFTKQIFISYRKKDKNFVVKLISAIYDNENMIDTAIWYDEYLTPGENFDDAIKNAIVASDLFVLAVTSNLLEDPNYVIREEYPEAKENQLKILPIHESEVDGEELRRLFEGLPDGMFFSDKSHLHKLLEKLLVIEPKVEPVAPKELYLHGMSFLKGIGVEYRPERGIAYITDAAEAGLLDAMHQLMLIYKHGNGTAIDYEQAIDWQIKVVQKLSAESKGDVDDYALLFEEYLELIILLSDAGRIGETLEWCNKALAEYETYEKSEKEISLIDAFIKICGYKMDIETTSGDYEKAKDTCLKCVNALLWLKATSDEDITEQMALCLQRAGYISRLQGNYKDAKVFYLRYADLIDKLGNEAGYDSIVSTRIDIYSICALMGEIEEAEVYLLQAREYVTGGITAGTYYGCLGDLYREKKDYTTAKVQYELSREKYLEVYEKTKSINVLRNIAVNNCKLGIICSISGDKENAWHWFEAYRDIGEELYEIADTPDHRRGLVSAYCNLVQLCVSTDAMQAVKYLERAEEVYQKVPEEMWSVEESKVYVLCQQLQGEIYYKLPMILDDEKEIRHYLEKSALVYEKIARRSDAKADWKMYIEVMIGRSAWGESKEILTEACDVCKRLIKRKPFCLAYRKMYRVCKKALKSLCKS